MSYISRFARRHPIIGAWQCTPSWDPLLTLPNKCSILREKFNPMECLRFGLLGTLVVAPTLYGWIKLASVIVRGNTFRHCVMKAYVEQIIWAPFAVTQFYIVINLLSGKSLKQSVEILKEKFWTTYKVGFCIWPFIQTINYKFIRERNRVPFVSFCSFLWNIFLSYMHNRSGGNKSLHNSAEVSQR